MLLRVLVFACFLARHTVSVHECVNGVWKYQTEGGLPDYQCDRSPVAIHWHALTQERCSTYKDDADWDVQDPHIRREPYWQSAASLFRHHLHNRTLWLVGDSITGLWKYGLDCELWRHGFVRAGGEETNAAAAPLRTLDYGPESSLNVDLWVNTSTRVAFLGCNKVNRGAWEHMLSPNDVVLFNYGLHYGIGEDAQYMDDMNWLLERLSAWGGVAVWRETGAQHFASAAYNASLQAADDGTWTCGTSVEKMYTDNRVWTRNCAMRAAIAEKAPDVRVLDFYNITVPRSDLLEGRYCALKHKRTCLDCTHYTWTPQFYASLYHRLYMLLAGGAAGAGAHHEGTQLQ